MRMLFVLLVAFAAFVSSASAQSASPSNTHPSLGRILTDALDRLKDWYEKREKLICPKAPDVAECRRYSDLAATHAMFVYAERLEAILKGQQWSCDKSVRCPAAKAFAENWLAKYESPTVAKEIERVRKEPGYKSPLVQQGSVPCDKGSELLNFF